MISSLGRPARLPVATQRCSACRPEIAVGLRRDEPPLEVGKGKGSVPSIYTRPRSGGWVESLSLFATGCNVRPSAHPQPCGKPIQSHARFGAQSLADADFARTGFRGKKSETVRRYSRYNARGMASFYRRPKGVSILRTNPLPDEPPLRVRWLRAAQARRRDFRKLGVRPVRQSCHRCKSGLCSAHEFRDGNSRRN